MDPTWKLLVEYFKSDEKPFDCSTIIDVFLASNHVDAFDEEGHTALYHATVHSHWEGVKYLLSKGACPSYGFVYPESSAASGEYDFSKSALHAAIAGKKSDLSDFKFDKSRIDESLDCDKNGSAIPLLAWHDPYLTSVRYNGHLLVTHLLLLADASIDMGRFICAHPHIKNGNFIHLETIQDSDDDTVPLYAYPEADYYQADTSIALMRRFADSGDKFFDQKAFQKSLDGLVVKAHSRYFASDSKRYFPFLAQLCVHSEELIPPLHLFPDINIRNLHDGETPLMRVARYSGLSPRYGNHGKDVIQALVQAGADMYAVDNEGLQCIHNRHYIKTFYEEGIDFDRTLAKTIPVLHWLAVHNKLEEDDIASAEDINMRDEHGRTALMVACASGAVKSVEALLAAKCDTSLADVNGNTALHYAAPHISVVALLAGLCDFAVKDHNGHNAIHHLIKSDNDFFNVYGRCELPEPVYGYKTQDKYLFHYLIFKILNNNGCPVERDMLLLYCSIKNGCADWNNDRLVRVEHEEIRYGDDVDKYSADCCNHVIPATMDMYKGLVDKEYAAQYHEWTRDILDDLIDACPSTNDVRDADGNTLVQMALEYDKLGHNRLHRAARLMEAGFNADGALAMLCRRQDRAGLNYLFPVLKKIPHGGISPFTEMFSSDPVIPACEDMDIFGYLIPGLEKRHIWGNDAYREPPEKKAKLITRKYHCIYMLLTELGFCLADEPQVLELAKKNEFSDDILSVLSCFFSTNV